MQFLVVHQNVKSDYRPFLHHATRNGCWCAQDTHYLDVNSNDGLLGYYTT